MSFTNERERAAAFAAYKELERALKEDGELPAGFSEDLSGVEVRVKIPQGTRVYREIGKNGVEKIIQLDLSANELDQFKNSINAVNELFNEAKKIDKDLK